MEKDWAVETAAQLITDQYEAYPNRPSFTEAIAQALRAARERGLDEAASIADKQSAEVSYVTSHYAAAVAKEIRALKGAQ
jgi:hypothetical protein